MKRRNLTEWFDEKHPAGDHALVTLGAVQGNSACDTHLSRRFDWAT
jgi:1-aminocyclopropane-1-carboxylate deaminase/D-cysteine desulfhydrase-like pyridoxal-dependent ACC family enzyme